MGRRANRLLVFEETTYGSYTAMKTVPLAGFRWEEGPEGEPYLAENEPAESGPSAYRSPSLTTLGTPGRTGAPLGEFLSEFARVNSPESTLAFASRYGLLGHPGEPESIRLWEKHTQRVRMLRELAKWMAARDQDKLAWVVRWPKGEDQPLIRPGAVLDYLDAREQRRPYIPIPDDAYSPPITISEHGQADTSGLAWFWKIPWRRIVEPEALLDAEGLPRWERGEVIGPARFYVCDEVNKAVEGHVNTKLMPFAPGEQFRVYVVSDCLLATIYLQLQLLFGRGQAQGNAAPMDNYPSEWKPCGAEPNGCLNWVPRVGNKRYCSPPCRDWGRAQAQRTYRQKGKQHPAALVTNPPTSAMNSMTS